MTRRSRRVGRGNSMEIRALGWSGASGARSRRRAAPPAAGATGQGVLDGFLHFSGLEAPGADVGALGDTIHQDAHLLEVRVEPAARGHHRMAPVVPERGFL